MSLFLPRRLSCLLLGTVLLWRLGVADALPVPVSAVAADAVYLSMGSASGLAVGMKGQLMATDGRSAELEVLAVTGGRASCRVSPAGAELRVGDRVLFDISAPTPAPPDSAGTLTPSLYTPEAQQAIKQSNEARGLRLQGWWRVDGTLLDQDGRARSQSRQSLGLRAGLAQWKDATLSVQARHRNDWEPRTAQEGWLDELSLQAPALQGRLMWEAGRLADGRNALSGPLDGVALEGAASAPLAWGLSLGSRPGQESISGRHALGAGGRLRWQQPKSPWRSDAKVRVERNSQDEATAGLSWSNQLKVLKQGRVEHWFRAEFSESNNWDRALARFSTTRLRWSGEVWQWELRHQLNAWPVVIPQDLGSSTPQDSLDERRSQQLALSLARLWAGVNVQAHLRGRGEDVNADMERLLEFSAQKGWDRGVVRRLSLHSQILIGPQDHGGDVELRLGGAREGWPEVEGSVRGWSMDHGLETWTGWNTGLQLRGRVWSQLRWELGGMLQREDGAWEREIRVGLRGEVRRRPSRGSDK